MYQIDREVFNTNAAWIQALLLIFPELVPALNISLQLVDLNDIALFANLIVER